MSITVELTSSGRKTRITVDQAEFVRICPDCRMEFLTINADQIYCRDSHRVMACRTRSILQDSRFPS
jgi:hypothetical protein